MMPSLREQLEAAPVGSELTTKQKQFITRQAKKLAPLTGRSESYIVNVLTHAALTIKAKEAMRRVEVQDA